MTMRGKRRDELVLINQEVLRALLEERHLTIAALARMTGDSEQTLAHVLQPGARCQKSRRARIAKALQVPQELLAGESFPVPLGFMLPDGFEFLYSARTQLAGSRFITRVRAALRRDLRSQSKKGRPVPAPPEYFVEDAVIAAFAEFMMIGEWRKRFIEWSPDEHQRRGYTEPATIRPWEGDIRVKAVDKKGFVDWETAAPRRERDPGHETAILSVIRSMEHVFEPWFRGTARLNYRSIRDFVHLPNHPFAKINESAASTSPYAILPGGQNRKPGRAPRSSARTP